MGYKCAALNCRSGYDNETKDPSITFHAFPLKDEELLRKWLSRLARKDFSPTSYSKLCSLHFTADDFVKESNDQRKRETTVLVRRRLKKNAYPTLFSSLPSYYASKSIPQRSGLSASSSRRENEAARLDELSNAFLDADKIENFDDLITKVTKELQDHKHCHVLHQTEKGAYSISFIYLMNNHLLLLQQSLSILIWKSLSIKSNKLCHHQLTNTYYQLMK